MGICNCKDCISNDLHEVPPSYELIVSPTLSLPPEVETSLFTEGRGSSVVLLPFGIDPADAPAEEMTQDAGGWRACGICLTEPGPGASLWHLCGDRSCAGFFCEPCVRSYVATRMEEAFHYVPLVPCPACRGRISTTVWLKFASEPVHARLSANAEALLTVRCATCDETGTLFKSTLGNAAVQQLPGEQRERAVLGPLAAEGSEGLMQLRFAWQAFCHCHCSGDVVVAALVASATAAGIQTETSVPGLLPRDFRKILDAIVLAVADVERRVALQLAILRRYPMIRTSCCWQKTCFKCKVKGWHRGETCEERQQKFLALGVGIQPCPLCGVPIQKTEGCSEVRCVCGHKWLWAERGREIPGGVPLVAIAPSLPVGGVKLLESLLRHRAELSARSHEGRGALHYAAAGPVRQHGEWWAGLLGGEETSIVAQQRMPRSDDSRVQALLALDEARGSDAARSSLDTADVNGDTGLSIAIANGNIAAARLLLESGAEVKEQVLTTLHRQSSPSDALAAGELLQPRLQADTSLVQTPGLLWLWVQLGMPTRVRRALQLGDEVDGDALEALVLASAGAAEPVAGGGPKVLQGAAVAEVKQLLYEAAANHRLGWAQRLRRGATSLLRRELFAAHRARRRFDTDLMRALLHQRADPNSTVESEDGKVGVPIVSFVAGADVKVHGAEPIAAVVTALLEARALPNQADGDGDPPLWWALSQPNAHAVELLVSNGARWPSETGPSLSTAHRLQEVTRRQDLRQVAAALAPALQALPLRLPEPTPTGRPEFMLPLWMQLLLPDILQLARREAPIFHGGRVDDAAVATALLLNSGSAEATGAAGASGSSSSGVLLKELQQAVAGVSSLAAWDALLVQASTALLLKELRGAHDEGQDLDVDLLQLLLRHRADPNARQQSSTLFQEFWEEDEDYTPLMLLASARGVSAPSAEAAARLLLEHRADVELVDADGDNALAWAVMKQRPALVAPLVEAGSSLSESLVTDGAHLGSIFHPELLQQIARPVTGLVRSFLKEVPEPPLWALVQFSSPEEIQRFMQQRDAHRGPQNRGAPVRVDATVVEAFLRRKASAIAGDHEALSKMEAMLQAAVSVARDETWLQLRGEAVTRILRGEVAGAMCGRYDVDLPFVEQLLELGADPMLQIRVRDPGEDIDEEEEEDGLDDEDTEDSEEDEEEGGRRNLGMAHFEEDSNSDENEDSDEDDEESLGTPRGEVPTGTYAPGSYEDAVLHGQTFPLLV